MSEHIHFIGIGGSGLSAIARLLREQGYNVSGSDLMSSPITDELGARGMMVFIGHDPKNIHGASLIIRSSAIPDENIEVQAAKLAGIPVLKRSEFMDRLMHNLDCIAIAGTHGKTTTTSMIAWILVSLGKDPSFIIGGISRNLGTNAHSGKGTQFVIEGDEYDHMFAGLKPLWAVITNIEYDHPDCYPTPEEYFSAFSEFADQIQPGGALIINIDDAGARRLLSSHPHVDQIYTYSFGSGSNTWADSIRTNLWGGSDCTLWVRSGNGQATKLVDLSLQVPGQHNISNAMAAMSVAHQMGLPLDAAAGALASYSGVCRRFEVVGEADGIVIIDDYAHHPTEIRATLQGARSRYPSRRIWAIWQPHTFSRIKTFFSDFTDAFILADNVIVTEVYAAREKNESFSAAQLVEHMNHTHVRFSPTFANTIEILLGELVSGDVLLVLSAGDATQISATILDHLQKKFIGGKDD